MPEPAAHPSLVTRLAEIRREVAELLGDIDTRVKPKPVEVIPAGEKLPGPLWRPAPTMAVRVVDPDETPASVFVSHPYLWEGDLHALDPDDARRIGMAFLAAADWADRVRARDINEETRHA